MLCEVHGMKHDLLCPHKTAAGHAGPRNNCVLPCASHDCLLVLLMLLLPPQAQGCQYLGVWDKGQFVSGTWAHREGTQFQGSFAQSQPVSGGAPTRGMR
jgi:hypothetical protein